jgi:hypothetical protein
MPKQRRLVGEEKENALKMLSIKSNKKLLQNHIKNAVGKNVVLKDLHNLNAKNKPKRGNDFEQILKEMKEYPSKCLYNNATLHNCKQKSIY